MGFYRWGNLSPLYWEPRAVRGSTFKPGVGQSRALHASLTARKFTLYFMPSRFVQPHSSPSSTNLKWHSSWTVNQAFAWDLTEKRFALRASSPLNGRKIKRANRNYTHIVCVDDTAALCPGRDDVVGVVGDGVWRGGNGVGQTEPSTGVGDYLERHAAWDLHPPPVTCNKQCDACLVSMKVGRGGTDSPFPIPRPALCSVMHDVNFSVDR